MTSINNIFAEILKDIAPTPEELYNINEIVDIISILLKSTAKELNIEPSLVLKQILVLKSRNQVDFGKILENTPKFITI